jgi:hypothetical protein
MNKLFWIVLTLIVGVGVFRFMPKSDAKYDQPAYTVEKKDGAFEVRKYPPMILAEVSVEGNREDAANQGFRILFGYITGKNGTGEKLAMTIPVFQELIAFGVGTESPPVPTQWAFRFVMPAGKKLADLPMPQDDRIRLYEAPAMKVAVQSFKGRFSTKNLTAHKNELDAWVIAKGLVFEPNRHEIFAAYNGPFTLPSKRRNEVMFRLKSI